MNAQAVVMRDDQQTGSGLGCAFAQQRRHLFHIGMVERGRWLVRDDQIGPTDQGMVRIYVEGDGIDLPLDFDPDEATEIAEELLASAEAARSMGSGKKGKPRR